MRSEVERPIEAVEWSVTLATHWGHPCEQGTIQRTGQVEADDQPREARLYLPWDAADPTDWAYAGPLSGVVLRVKAHAFRCLGFASSASLIRAATSFPAMSVSTIAAFLPGTR